MQSRVARSSRHLLTSRQIRQSFLDYFVQENGHTFVRSSPVVPFCDPSLAFVNAGMNQFKNIFLGKELPPAPTAANSQKCIRVGGKHNDLNVVGSDGYHHTFFEMLGNWSFGHYFKREACELAYQLLTGPYRINPKRLYVTYFGGDSEMGLEPDLECVDIWRRIGIDPQRILPFDRRDNFWEMGATGPCGPCTEIHFDHLSEEPRVKAVNAGLPDLTELWNVVFIEFNRGQDGEIRPLPQKHVDTGMGFERLAAVLQEKRSNYDTDLFLPIFEAIQKEARAEPYGGRFDSALDRDYRVLADHSRMITACISDGMFPVNNHKLLRILRKCISISEETFKSPQSLKTSLLQVSEILGDAYPEMRNVQKVFKIVDHEVEVYEALRKDTAKAIKSLPITIQDLIEHDLLDCPGFPEAYKDLLQRAESFEVKNGLKVIPGEVASRLYTTYGLDFEAIQRLCEMGKLQTSEEEFQKCLENYKKATKRSASLGNSGSFDEKALRDLPDTDDSYKYAYSFNQETGSFEVPSLRATVQAVLPFRKGTLALVTDRTNFYAESGGQESDQGTISGPGFCFQVEEMAVRKNLVLHIGRLEQGEPPRVGQTVSLSPDSAKRTGNTRNHTAAHLLNAVVRRLHELPTCQKSSAVQRDALMLELSVYGSRFSPDDFSAIETEVRRAVKSASRVSTRTIDSRELLSNPDIVLVPGEVYPDAGLRLVEVAGSRELCCGTHAISTSDLQDFCLTNVRAKGRASYQFVAVTGPAASRSHEKAQDLLRKVADLRQKVASIDENLTNLGETETEIKMLHGILASGELDGVVLPFCARRSAKRDLDRLEVVCKPHSKELVRRQIEQEGRLAPGKCILCLKSRSLLTDIPPESVVALNPGVPVIAITFANHLIAGVCSVPEELEAFDGQKWFSEVAREFGTTVSKTKSGWRMKEVKRNEAGFDRRALKATEVAELYFNRHFGK